MIEHEIPESMRKISFEKYTIDIIELEAEDVKRQLATLRQAENNRLAEEWNDTQEPVETEQEHMARLADEMNNNVSYEDMMRSFSER